MTAFKVIAVLLLVVLASWIAFALILSPPAHSTPRVLELGNAFEGNLQLPAEKIQAAFGTARDHMLKINSVGTELHAAGNIAAWITFGATALITLIVGFFGRAPQSNGAPANTEGLPARTVRLIGLLASIAAVTTAFSSLSISKSQDYFTRADSIRDLIVHDRAQILDAKTADEAQAVLDDLLLKSQR